MGQQSTPRRARAHNQRDPGAGQMQGEELDNRQQDQFNGNQQVPDGRLDVNNAVQLPSRRSFPNRLHVLTTFYDLRHRGNLRSLRRNADRMHS